MKSKTIFLTEDIDIREKPYVPSRFYKEIFLHIFKNYHANNNPSFKTPLILAISGAPGMGKTFQTEIVLDDLGVKKYVLSGTEFENEHAGVPEKNIRNIYKSISDDVYFRKIKYAAIVIDDIDAALGQWGGLVQYTMNRQLLLKTLIDFADNPYRIYTYDDFDRAQEHQTSRIPIIVTLNDETKMYEPLMRNGRTTIFPWIPNEDEIAKTLDGIFSNIFSDKTSFYSLYKDLLTYAQNNINHEISSLPISLFADICSSLNDEWIWEQLLKQESFEEISTSLRRMCDEEQYYSYTQLLELGKHLLHGCNNYLLSE